MSALKYLLYKLFLIKYSFSYEAGIKLVQVYISTSVQIRVKTTIGNDLHDVHNIATSIFALEKFILQHSLENEYFTRKSSYIWMLHFAKT